MWIAIQGHVVYLKIIKVMDAEGDYTCLYLAIGYGVPALIVAITGIVTASLQDTGYANDDL
jgi:hypothetical protein